MEVVVLMSVENVYNTLGHLGYEFLPKWVLRNKWICSVLATSTHHDAHHRYFQGNFSHYFNIWDKLMGTEFKQYPRLRETVLDQVASEERSTAPAQVLQ